MRILFLAVVSWAMQAQPYIFGATGFRPVAYNIDAAATAGIEAYHRGRYGFPSELARMSKGQDVSDISRSILILKNTSARAIDAMCVIYRFKLPGETTVRQSFFVLAHDIRASHFLPGETYAVYPGAGTVANSLNLNPEILRRTREWLLQVTDVSISLDAVIFDDGELVGPNTSGLDVRCNAERKTAVEIRREYAESTDREGFIASLLASKSDPAVNIPDLMRHTGTWEAYTRRSIGSRLLEIPEADRSDELTRIRRNFPGLFTRSQ